MRDNHSLADSLRSAIGQLVRAVRTTDTLPPGEAAALGTLDREGPRTTADLAQRRGIRHQSAAKAVKELSARGLVRAEPHPSDGRKLLLHLTPTGRARLEEDRGRRADWLAAAIESELTPAERRQLDDCVSLLGRLSKYRPGGSGE
jgi:DNA-binding MarR family transcriptional regulator